MKTPYYLDKQQGDMLIEAAPNAKYRSALLLMMDCGLRVSECVSLKYEDFDFKRRLLHVKSLKKQKDIVRTIPLSDRCYQSLAAYIYEEQKHKKRKESDKEPHYLFPANSKTGHMCRFRGLKPNGTKTYAKEFLEEKISLKNIIKNHFGIIKMVTTSNIIFFSNYKNSPPFFLQVCLFRF